MDLPDCPPGAEGYDDTVTEKPKKPETEETLSKAEQEFQDYVNSQKIVLENGETRSMVERRGRDPCGQWIYLCFPCSAICSGESTLQTHILGKKHKNHLSSCQVWPNDIFEKHPFNQKKSEAPVKPQPSAQSGAVADVPESSFDKYKNLPCEIQEALDGIKVPMIGLEYLIEFLPEHAHHKPSYTCTLCNKHGHPRTIINHMISARHTYSYIKRHYSKATTLMAPYWSNVKYHEGVCVVANRIVKRVEETHGRMRPLQMDRDDFQKDKDEILRWIFNGPHFSENDGNTFEEVVDIDLITTLEKNPDKKAQHGAADAQGISGNNSVARDPSPPKVAAPSKPLFNNFTRSTSRKERRAGSIGSLSDISDDQDDFRRDNGSRSRGRGGVYTRGRYAPYGGGVRGARGGGGGGGGGGRDARAASPRHTHRADDRDAQDPKLRPRNYGHKTKLAEEQTAAAEESAKKTYAYHEKNPEKHPLYPEEWKKFWNRRYKEIQGEGKDPSKHDFKPEWIQFWTKRMKEIHEEELRVKVLEIYRKFCLTPPDMNKHDERPPEPKPRPHEQWHTQNQKRRSPDMKRRRDDVRRRTPERRRTPDKRRSPERRRSPELKRDYRREKKSPPFPQSPARRRSPRMRRTPSRSRSPHYRARSPARSSRSPLARRMSLPTHAPRNRSPHAHAQQLAPSMQTVLISDDELRPDDGLSPWNSADEMGSPARSRTGSVASRASRARHEPYAARHIAPSEVGPTDDVVATLRLLVALEDHLGSLGPKVIDLLGEALKMEKERPNSSEELLERESAVVLLETAKEKLKGAAQAGLVAGAAAGAVRAAVVRVAAALHHADTRHKQKEKEASKSSLKGSAKAAVPVAGVGEVDRAQIAQQMAEALIAQGKTDVSSEELAQLVDAVVGMAEAKKRSTQRKPEPEPKQTQKHTTTVSALQMLQSAYDENKEKQGSKEDAPDAMDGLSDSDLETLLKNFNELSAEEQHSLIAYLKKLEAREPQRVERLRQYVSAAVTSGPKPQEEMPIIDRPTPKIDRPNVQPVDIESDDDDYTVEEVFKSAKEKVKEDQIRQEMEIVKKSLEETTPASAELPKTSTIIDLTNSLSSASDLLALVQASIQSQAPAAPASIATTAEVVHSNIQPKSFGDAPETKQNFPHPSKPLLNNPNTEYQFNPPQSMQNQNFNMSNQPPNQQGFMRPPSNPNFGGNRNIPNNQPRWSAPMNHNNMPDQRGPGMQGQFDNKFNQGAFHQGSNPNFNNRQEFERPPGMNQQYGNFNQQNNFRGRGHYGGPARGRGRGGYY